MPTETRTWHRPVRAFTQPSGRIVARANGASASGRQDLGAVHKLVLAAVWVTFATSGIVFSEPAPVDVLMMGLILLLPAAGLVVAPPRLVVFAALWGLVAAGGLVASTMSDNMAASTVFTIVSIYLYAAAVVTAGFVARSPRRHVDLIFSAWLVAGIATAMTGLLGYFDLLPGAYDLFTRFGRASGTFKDPNVMGAFLVAPFLYTVHLLLHASAPRALWIGASALVCAGLLALATLLTFSRGAWLNLAAGLFVYASLAWLTAPSSRERERITLAAAGGVALLGLVTLAVLQDDNIARTLSERATLTQSYDEGPEGRFGGQRKAFDLIVTNPAGIGAGQFQANHHFEDVHNVYLSVFNNNGWFGGFAYLGIVIATFALGLSALGPTAQSENASTRPLLLVALAAFAATAFEGVVIDTDHWRSFYLLTALVWGLSATPRSSSIGQPADTGRVRSPTERELRR